MNAAGLAAVLGGLSARLNMAFYGGIVTSGQIKQDELDGTRKMASTAVTTLRNTPPDKLEGLVSKYNDLLTQSLTNFNSKGTKDLLGSLRDAQVMLGYVSTILAKAGIKR